MKKYSKGKIKLKRMVIFLIGLCIVLLILGIVLLFVFCLRNRIEVSSEITDAINVSDDVAQNSSPIIIDNLVIGALYNNRWVSANKYYLKSNLKNDVEINVYNKDKKAGTYKIKELYVDDECVFANTSFPNYIDEYFALPKNENYSLISQFKEVDAKQEDYDYVKRALGFYRIYNSSISISNVYDGYININIPVRIISVTSSTKGIFGGVYSAIVIAFINEKKSDIVQYSYTKDLDNSDDFPIYSVEFLADFNGDGNCELITREITEFNATYNIFDYKNKRYSKVLSETMKSK